mmetsp:Transcript_22173/g.36701  ORF Transcript_22173/g.36701 Transcript_22173/m.36701 type:complete len:235 (+) Transcript_22173:228-932(+)
MVTNKTSSCAGSVMNQPKSNGAWQVRIPDGLNGRYQPPPRRTTLAETDLTTGTLQIPAESTSAKSTHKVPADYPAKNAKKVTVNSPIEARTTPTLLGQAGPNGSAPTRNRSLSRTQKRSLAIGMPRGLEHRWVPPRKKTKISSRERTFAPAAGSGNEERGAIEHTEGLLPKVSPNSIARPATPLPAGYTANKGTPVQADRGNNGPAAGLPPKVSPNATATKPTNPLAKDSETRK